jgi:AcrR family transcriptional regulator
MGAPIAPEPGRRTQAERREATRTALLEATMDCLVEEGYANTTTRRIAERAGVTPGAPQHHFASKAELVAEAVRHARGKFIQEMLGQGPPLEPSIQLHTERLLDLMWEEFYKAPVFKAVMELLIAARTDTQLRENLAGAQHELFRWIEIGGPILYPELAGWPGLTEIIATGQATMRGRALLTFGSDADPDEGWPATRAHILSLTAQFVAEAEAEAAS